MKIVLMLVVIVISFSPLLAQSAPEAQKPDQSKPTIKELKKEAPCQDSPLVCAAKAAKSNAAKSKPRVVIDDKDVKNSTGKLIYVKEAPLAKLPPATEAAKPAATNAQIPAVLAAQAEQRFRAAERDVKSLEMELSRLENDYYEEDDATYRDDVIEARFDLATKQLAEARQKLLTAREDYNRLASSAASRNPNP